MDDEDLGTFGISPQGIQTSSSYDSQRGQHKRKHGIDLGGPIPGTPVLEEILRPTSETMGMKLLRRLGWRPGQGVGPRISRKQKRAAEQEKKRMYSCQGPPGRGHIGSGSSSEYESDDENDENVTFAPDDVHGLLQPKAKQDTFGLGYVPLDRTPVLGGAASHFGPTPLDFKEKKKRVLIKGQAFGVGAFEEDDEDIYATEDMSNYDFGEEKEDLRRRDRTPHSQQDKTIFGVTEALQGFKLSSTPQNSIKSYPCPSLPPEFTPFHKPQRRRFERKECELRGLGRHDLTPEQRARSIGEKPTATVEVRSGVKGSTSHQPPEPVRQNDKRTIDTSEVDKLYEEFKNSEKTPGLEFKPFTKQPEKQKRYELYLRMKEKGQKDRFYLAQPRNMTEWERERELREFSRAAQLFQPLTSTMATRFVSAGGSDSTPQLKDGLNTDIAKMVTSDGKSDLTAPEVNDERVKAARLKMYGRLTQITENWHPDRLLCRRFNVPDPYPESNFVGIPKNKREKVSLFSMMNVDSEDTAGLRKTVPETSNAEETVEEQSDEAGPFEDKPETYGLKVAVDGPPTLDLFKAIFQDSDSDSDEETEKSNFGGAGSQKLNATENSSVLQGTETKKDPIDSFLASVRSNQEGKAKNKDSVQVKKPGRALVSRFEPRTEESVSTIPDAAHVTEDPLHISQGSLCSSDDSCIRGGTFKPVFIPQKKKESIATKATAARGIFANVDLASLTVNWNSKATSSQEEEASGGGDSVNDSSEVARHGVQEKEIVKIDSDVSTDPEDEYGPAVPSHLKNRGQTVRATPGTSTDLIRRLGEQHKHMVHKSEWVEKKESRDKKSSKKHKHKRKNKKKDKKNKSHKERRKKKKERKCINSSSSSSSSTES